MITYIFILSNFDTKYLLAIYGFITTSILIYNQVKKSKVYGKVISKTFFETATFSTKTDQNKNIVLTGQQYILKLSLSCYQKTLNYKDVNVNLTYGNEIFKGEIIWSKYSNFQVLNENGIPSNKKLIIPSKDFITFNNILEKEKTTFFYLNFIVPNKEGNKIYDKLELVFIKPNNKKLKVQIFEIDAKQYFIDDETFIDL